MAFDRNNDAHLLALQTEVNTDPLGMGYDLNSNETQLLKLLNDPANNVGGETGVREFDYTAMLDALVVADFNANQVIAGAPEMTAMLVEMSIQGEDISAWKTKWQALFDGIPGSNTSVMLDAQTRLLSRAEVLFGIDTHISRDDWHAARDFTP